MTKYEDLLLEYDHLDITEHNMKSPGYYGDDAIWINKNMSQHEKTCILAEELGHHELTVGDITDQTDDGNVQQEMKARRWAAKKLIPLQEILRAVSHGCREMYEIAEYLEVDEKFLRESIERYGFV